MILWVAIILLLSLRPAGIVSERWPGCRIVWTVAVALLPLIIVVLGFYTWRQICPLMFFSRMSEWVGWPDRSTTLAASRRRRFVSPWLARHYPAVTWSFLYVMLVLRILALNSDADALAWTFVGLAVIAMAVGFRYTGKAWCNFFCPVGTIERIYTDGDRPGYRYNSQCPTCTRCKTQLTHGLCPDINQEHDYWEELSSGARAFSFYAFPGLVLGFYGWYFLHQPDYWDMRLNRPPGFEVHAQDGVYDWGYYLSGDWTRTVEPWRHWWDRGIGLHGWPYVPTWLAAPLVLAVTAGLSWLIFLVIETAWRRALERRGATASSSLDKARHVLFCYAGFIAFNLFYFFAGAPSLRQLPPGLYDLFRFGVIAFSAGVLLTRLSRSRERLWRMDQARKWVQRWPWRDVPAPTDLEEAYTTYALQARYSDNQLNTYKDMVRSLLTEHRTALIESGILGNLAEKLGLTEQQANRLREEVEQESPELLQVICEPQDGDWMRLVGYRAELERCIEQCNGNMPSDEVIAQLQSEYRVDGGEHAGILAGLRDPHGPAAQGVRRELDEIGACRQMAAAFDGSTEPVLAFLNSELNANARALSVRVLKRCRLFATPGSAPPAIGVSQRKGRGEGPGSEEASCGVGTPSVCSWISDYLPDPVRAPALRAICAETLPDESSSVSELLMRAARHHDPFIRSAAIYALWRRGDTVEPLARVGISDASAVVREASLLVMWSDLTEDERAALKRDSAPSVREAANSAEGVRSPLERMFVLRSGELFGYIEAQELYDLATAAVEMCFGPGEILCHEGEMEDTVYLIVEGSGVAVQQRDGVEAMLGPVRPGECVGEMAILDPAPRFATVRAAEEGMRALCVGGELFRGLLADSADAALSVIRLLIHRERRAFRTESAP